MQPCTARVCANGGFRRFDNASPQALGIELRRGSDGRVVTDNALRTSIPNVFAVGDVVHGHQPLTPVAIRNGRTIARRIAAERHQASAATTTATAATVGPVVGLNGQLEAATTVFTPAEYGSVGLSEEQAVTTLGQDRVETYLWQWTSLEAQAASYALFPDHLAPPTAVTAAPTAVEVKRGVANNKPLSQESPISVAGVVPAADDGAHPHTCFAKLVCDKLHGEQVVGFHFVGPNAGEVTQGFALVRAAYARTHATHARNARMTSSVVVHHPASSSRWFARLYWALVQRRVR